MRDVNLAFRPELPTSPGRAGRTGLAGASRDTRMSEEPRTERELLRALRAGDESAFEEAVLRWTGLVYAACLRVLGRAEAAEDAAQAVFLQLIRKAPELGEETVLPAWLYRTAHFIARRAQTAAWRRARHEKEARKMRPTAELAQTALASDTWAEIAPRLDEALEALPEHYREVLVLHILCGKKQREVAEALHLKESTVSMRVQRGLEKLRTRLLGRGTTVSASAFGVLLGKHASALAPAHLPGAIKAARKHGPVSPEVAELAKQSLRTAARSSTFSTWALAAACLLALGLASWAVRGGPSVDPSPNATPLAEAGRPDASVAEASLPKPVAAPQDLRWTFENGPPPGLEVLHGEWAWDKARGEMVCEGQTAVRLPVAIRRFPVLAEMRLRYHLVDAPVQCVVLWYDGSTLPGARFHLWHLAHTIHMKQSDILTTQSYLLDRYKVQLFAGSLQAVARLDGDDVPRHLVLVGKHCRIREIRVREISMEDIPAQYRDPQRLIEANSFQMETHDPVVLPARPAK